MIKVKEMGIKTSKEYFKRYKEDSRLHCGPDEFYKKDWISWDNFLGKTVEKGLTND
jgi:hypothetical protein